MLGDRSWSISQVPVELAVKIFTDLKDKVLLIIGDGKLCDLISGKFTSHPLSDVMVTYPQNVKPCNIRENTKVKVIPFEQLHDAMHVADIVISSTSLPDFVIHYADIARMIKTRRQRPMFFIDIGVPEDVDERVNSIDNVYVYDFIDLQEMADKHDIEKAEEIIAEEAGAFLERTGLSRTGSRQVLLREKAREVSYGDAKKTFGQEGADHHGVVRTLAAVFIRKSKKLVIGTRKSKLALWQAEWVKSRLKKRTRTTQRRAQDDHHERGYDHGSPQRGWGQRTFPEAD